jgi:hypothetical protein
MANFWIWLDGKKTVIGALLLWLGLFLHDFVIGQLGVTSAAVPTIIDFCNWLGQILLPVGIMHKAAKNVPPPTP